MKKLLFLFAGMLFYTLSFAQTQKFVDLKCKTFNVTIGCCGLTVSTDITVCCGCMYGLCGCTVAKSATSSTYDGYVIVDDILKNKKLNSGVLTITRSNTLNYSEDNLNYAISPGDYQIMNGADNHKYIVVKVSGK